uniref:Uncharacterized protein n=1 Tax=Micromonas pusilla TaxID=38833 RepID=A0A7S0NME0_MICPS|mmetsp:Transcript_6460/g.26850  ORF Transcript_6460/g.26850 Transcript_6460/m.26850 type:complete len:152 (+) Transcript_6460:358-813(+)
MKQIEKERAEAAQAGEKRTPGSLPWGFEHRAKVRDAEAKAYAAAATATARAQGSDGSAAPIAFASAHRHAPPTNPSTIHHATPGSDAAPDATIRATTGSAAAEVALLRVTTHAMEQLATALTAKPTRLDADERARFAAAMKRCADAVMRCR